MDSLLENNPTDFTKSLNLILTPLQIGIALTESKSGLLFSNSYMHQWLDTFTAESLNLKLVQILKQSSTDNQQIALKYRDKQDVIIKLHRLKQSHILFLAHPPSTPEQTVHSHLRLASRMKTLENLYRSMAHDLKSPLHASILNLARLQDQIKQYELPDEDIETIENELGIIRTELSRLGESIQFFLSQASPEKQASRIFDLRRVQRECTWLVKSLAKKQRIRIKAKHAKTSVAVFGNRDRLSVRQSACFGLHHSDAGRWNGARLGGRAHRTESFGANDQRSDSLDPRYSEARRSDRDGRASGAQRRAGDGHHYDHQLGRHRADRRRREKTAEYQLR